MAFSKIQNIENLTCEEIEAKIIELKKDIFYLNLKKATRQSIKPHLFKQKKHTLAQLLTLERHKRLKSIKY